ncbi:ras-like protein family member 10A [Trichosurus vulpecula]|uniref:ras-like protein family member 10A n=1 Tax=Trichosurus vulpecula TaxID=9337 RepID=UPI00186B1C6A|nr:ras-like protein family member 10A [Trichosurus vulpecula]
MGGTLRVAVLGAPGVGKTAIIRQFLYGDFPERHRPTAARRLYRPAVLLNGAVYDLSISDGGPGPAPAPAAGPAAAPAAAAASAASSSSASASSAAASAATSAASSAGDGGLQELPDLKDWSLQDMDAFVLVYDICSPDSFDYVKVLRQQIAENRPAGAPEAPIIVVGNKRDQQRQRFSPRRALAVLVKKSWKCGYMECSAKYNWHVVLLFRELLSSILARGCKHSHPAIRLQGALHPNRCSLM